MSALTLILRMGLGYSGTGTQRDWYKWIVHNRTGVQWTWYTTGLVHNRPVTQQDLDTMGLGHSGTRTQRSWGTMGLGHNGRPRMGNSAVDTGEIKVPSVENPEVTNVLTLK